MNRIWKKLNYRNGQPIVIVDVPESFQASLVALDPADIVSGCGNAKELGFLLAFVTERSAIKRLAAQLRKKAHGDPVIWFAYPKMSSERIHCDFNRDTGWEPVHDAGFRGVRQVAIDTDWSALRFRREEHIRKR